MISPDASQTASYTPTSQNTAIGIDLGTYYSCVAVHTNNKTVTIPNTDGFFTTPSYVSFNSDSADISVGLSAKNQLVNNWCNTVYDAKRLIGRKCSDQVVIQDKKLWPFNIINIKNQEDIFIQVESNNKIINLKPENVSSYILKYLKKCAEDYMNCEITKAVITVPAYFNDSQRQATKMAAEMAGLDVLKLINEPTSAAIAYGLGKKDEKTVLVVDIGAGTTDITLMMLDDGLYQVKATCGDTHLGGQDLDNKLVVYALKEFAKKNKSVNVNIDITGILNNKKQINKLKNACEEAKCILSHLMTSNILVEAFYQDVDLNVVLSRSVFEEVCKDEFNRIKQLLDKILQDASIKAADISEIILVGGGSKIVYVQNLIKTYFNKDPKKDINPDEAIASGAAIYAASLIDYTNNNMSLVLVDVAALSLGVESAGGVMTKIIHRNTCIPCTKEVVFSTYTDNQRSVIIKVFEGEREFTRNNNLLGIFELIGIPAMCKGEAQIKVKFMLDANGILKITAYEEVSKLEITVIITNNNTSIIGDNGDVNKLIKEAEINMSKDRDEMNMKMSKDKLIAVINNIKENISKEDIKVKLGEDKIREISNKLTELISGVNNGMFKDSYEDKYKEVVSWIGWKEIAVRE